MLCSLKQKQSSHKIYIKQECCVGVRYQNVTKLCPPSDIYIGSKIHLDVPVPTTSISSYFIGCHLRIYLCNTNYLESGQGQWIPKALFFFIVCCVYSLEAAFSNVNDSFTHSRLTLRPKTFYDPVRDEYPQLTFL